MEKFKKLLPAFLIMLGLFGIGLGISSGLRSLTADQRVVSVRGLAEREVMADVVTWPIVVKFMGNSLPDLYNEVNSTNQQVVDFLKANNVKEDEISINAPEITDQQANSYNNTRVLNRYLVTSVIVVTSSDIENINSLIKRQGELLKKGIAISTEDWNYQVSYDFTGLNKIKPEMIAEATKNAREAAKKFADDSGSKIGKIKTASQGQFTIENRDNFTPYIKNVRVVTSITYFIED